MGTRIRAACCAALLLSVVSCGDRPPEPKVLVPATLEAIFGDSVTGAVGDPLPTPPAVRVLASNGAPVPGATVVFTAESGSGSVNGSPAFTNADGVATLGSWTLGPTLGPNRVFATTWNLPPMVFTVTGVPGPPDGVRIVIPPSEVVVNRVPFPRQPVLALHDRYFNPITPSNVPVTVSITNGGQGTLLGTTTVKTVDGIATFTDLAIAGTTGSRYLMFAAPGTWHAAGAGVTITAGAAASVAISGGNYQAALPNTSVPTPPSVKVTDADSNVVSGFAINFEVATGGGSVTNGSGVLSNASGIATVGSWTVGPNFGPNTLTATGAGLIGSPVTFTARATDVSITSVTPSTLTSGVTATITGTGFSASPASYTVTIDGVEGTVTGASSTTLTVTVPTLPCTAAHSAVVFVSDSAGVITSKSHPVQGATVRALSKGQSVFLNSAEDSRCNELVGESGAYFLAVSNASTTYSPTGASFELKGSSSVSSVLAGASAMAPNTSDPRPAPFAPSPEALARRAHLQVLKRDTEFLRINGPRWRAARSRAAPLLRAASAAVAVGDAMPVRMADLTGNGCNQYHDIAGRVAYVGAKAIIVEDNTNPMAGTIDSTYAKIGAEFDNVMFPILEANFGDLLKNDATLDNNGRIVMVFTRKINDNYPGLAGFVTSCDYFPRAEFAASNEGEYFYARVPTVAGTISAPDSPPFWAWLIRSVIMHEAKHIVMVSERFARNGGVAFEEAWLEESLAMIAEELYERARYSFTQRSNIGYGSSSNPVGPYCGVRPACGQPRGIVEVFEILGPSWFYEPHRYSPLGSVDGNDFSFYGTGWSIVRWGLDASPGGEGAIIKAMTQEPLHTGVANFSAHMGHTFEAAVPRWALSMALDDYGFFTPSDAALKQPSWNLRNVFAGYEADFPQDGMPPWPLNPYYVHQRAFTITPSVRPGTAAVVFLSTGTPTRQVLELKASGSAAAAPAELRIAIVRVF